MALCTDPDLREKAKKGGLKLNLGCGQRPWPGYENIDDRDGSGLDIRKLPLPDGCAKEIQAIHVLEHIYYWDVHDTLKEWFRLLESGGLMILEMPCFDKVIHFCMQGHENPYMTKFALYGGEISSRDPKDTHKWCFSAQELVDLLASAGFVNIERQSPLWHVPERDMRWLAYKP